MPPVPVITIDGTSGSGKGTISLQVAQALRYHLLDSGALYRILGCVVRQRGMALEAHELLAETVKALDIQFGLQGPGSVLVDGEDFSEIIRQEIAGEMASLVGAIPAVREALFKRQQSFRKAPGLVADGRDMGTVVFPDAKVKIYLTASVSERAKRRYNQLIAKGIGAILPDLLRELKERDDRDSSREVSPLKPAIDAHLIDTTDLSIEAVVSKVLKLIADSDLGDS
jgi:cytidylate kinase